MCCSQVYIVFSAEFKLLNLRERKCFYVVFCKLFCNDNETKNEHKPQGSEVNLEQTFGIQYFDASRSLHESVYQALIQEITEAYEQF